MFKSLIATCLTALSVNTQPLAVSPSLDPSKAITEDINGKYVVTYKYQSNEVNSSNDLIANNIYLLNFDVNNLTDFGFLYSSFRFKWLTGDITGVPDDLWTDDNAMPIFNDYFIEISPVSFNIIALSDTATIFSLSDVTCSIVVQLLDFTLGNEDYTALDFSFISYTDYNEIVSIREIRSHNNLYRLLYDFYYSIFSDEDLAEISTGYNMPFDNWLAHTCTIVTLITLIVVAFFFLRWLFKVISGLILLKR